MEQILQEIRERINELKYQRVHLRPFIDSDRAKLEALDKAISELEWVAELIKEKCAA